MKIERYAAPTPTLDEFAKNHSLVMAVHERSHPRSVDVRFYAYFKHAEVKKGICLYGDMGNGANPEEAIYNYVQRIAGQLLVVGAYTATRQEILVPMGLRAVWHEEQQPKGT